MNRKVYKYDISIQYLQGDYNMDEKTIRFKRILKVDGGSCSITLPKDYLDEIGAEKGSELELGLFEGKRGLFIAIFKKNGDSNAKKEE